jgi:hypothetical protein
LSNMLGRISSRTGNHAQQAALVTVCPPAHVALRFGVEAPVET